MTGTEDVIYEDYLVRPIRRGIPPKKIVLQMPGTWPAVCQRPHSWLAVERIETPLAQLVMMLHPWMQLWPAPPQEMLDHPIGRTTTVANP